MRLVDLQYSAFKLNILGTEPVTCVVSAKLCHLICGELGAADKTLKIHLHFFQLRTTLYLQYVLAEPITDHFWLH